MSLMRLTHDRYARMRSRGEFPEDTPVDAIPAQPEPDPIPTRGGTPKHSGWPQVVALVRNAAGTAVDHDFVAEARRLSDAILIASRYPYRAIVVTGTKRHFDNGKVIEVGHVR